MLCNGDVREICGNNLCWAIHIHLVHTLGAQAHIARSVHDEQRVTPCLSFGRWFPAVQAHHICTSTLCIEVHTKNQSAATMGNAWLVSGLELPISAQVTYIIHVHKCVCVLVHAYACVHVHRLLLLWYRCLFALHTQVASQRALFAGLCAGRRGRSRLLCGLLLLWHRCLLALAALSTMLWPLSLRRLLGLCTAGGRQGRRSRLLRVRRRLLQRCRRLQWHLQSCSFN